MKVVKEEFWPDIGKTIHLNNTTMKKNLTLLALLAMAMPMAWSQNSIFLAPVPSVGTVTAPSTFGGESKDAKHVGWTTLESVSFGFDNAAAESSARAGGGAGAGKVSAKTITISKTLDGSSTYFMSQVATGAAIPTMCIDMVRNTGNVSAGKINSSSYQNIVLTDARVAGYKQSIGTNGIPTEEITLSYVKIEVNYTPADTKTGATAPGSTKKFVWDFAKNTAN
jgi:type VI secretion system secreted protein Hcp